MADPYVYNPLSQSGQIRLLDLAPGSGDIHFSLRHVNLDQYPEYEAISYAWGDPKDTDTVYCDTKSIKITKSLLTCLRRLRGVDQPRVLWADAVCINQDDIPEKSEQVKLMSKIYSQPSRIIIWLGDDMTGLEDLQACLRGALEVLPPGIEDAHMDAHEFYETGKTIFREVSRLRREKKPNFNDYNWGPLTNLFCRPWFDRKWIIQEVMLAPDQVERLVVCGTIEFSWSELTDITYRIVGFGILGSLAGISVVNSFAPSSHHFYQEGFRPVQTMHTTYMIVMMKRYLTSSNLVDCVGASALFKCSDVRDHVYALLSLTSHASGIDPDYSLSISDVCLRLATNVLVNDRNLNVLSLAPHTSAPVGGKSPARLPDLPSWAPDLTCQGHLNTLSQYSIRQRVFRAGGETPPPGVWISSDSDGRPLLHLQGRIVDTVEEMAPSIDALGFPSDEDIAPKAGFSAKIKMRMRNWIRACRAVAFPSLSVTAGDGVATATATNVDTDTRWSLAFARTLLCSMTALRDPAPAEVLESVQDYVNYLECYFTPDWVLPESLRDIMLKYGPLIEQSLIVRGGGGGMSLCRTVEGRLGQVRTEGRKGDVICVLLGAEVPYLLRRSERDPGLWELVGNAYVDEVMQGETLMDGRYETVEIVME